MLPPLVSVGKDVLHARRDVKAMLQGMAVGRQELRFRGAVDAALLQASRVQPCRMAMLFEVHVGDITEHLACGKDGSQVVQLRTFSGTAALGMLGIPPFEELRGLTVDAIETATTPEYMEMRLALAIDGHRIVEGIGVRVGGPEAGVKEIVRQGEVFPVRQ